MMSHQRTGQRREVEDPEAHQRDDQEQRERYRADRLHGAVVDAVDPCERGAVAHRHADQQRPQEVRQQDTGAFHPVVHDVRRADAHQADHQHEQQLLRGDRHEYRALGSRTNLRCGLRWRAVRGRPTRASHDAFRDRSREQAAEDEACGGGRHAEFERALQVTNLRETRRICGGRAVTADQRDRAAEQPDQRVQVEQPRHADADRVLHDHHCDENEQQDDELATSLHQRAHVGAEAERGKEGEQQRVLRRRLDAELHVRDEAGERRCDSEQHAAHHRHRDAVALQELRPADEEVPDEEERRREHQRVKWSGDS